MVSSVEEMEIENESEIEVDVESISPPNNDSNYTVKESEVSSTISESFCDSRGPLNQSEVKKMLADIAASEVASRVHDGSSTMDMTVGSEDMEGYNPANRSTLIAEAECRTSEERQERPDEESPDSEVMPVKPQSDQERWREQHGYNNMDYANRGQRRAAVDENIQEPPKERTRQHDRRQIRNRGQWEQYRSRPNRYHEQQEERKFQYKTQSGKQVTPWRSADKRRLEYEKRRAEWRGNAPIKGDFHIQGKRHDDLAKRLTALKERRYRSVLKNRRETTAAVEPSTGGNSDLNMSKSTSVDMITECGSFGSQDSKMRSSSSDPSFTLDRDKLGGPSTDMRMTEIPSSENSHDKLESKDGSALNVDNTKPKPVPDSPVVRRRHHSLTPEDKIPLASTPSSTTRETLGARSRVTVAFDDNVTIGSARSSNYRLCRRASVSDYDFTKCNSAKLPYNDKRFSDNSRYRRTQYAPQASAAPVEMSALQQTPIVPFSSAAPAKNMNKHTKSNPAQPSCSQQNMNENKRTKVEQPSCSLQSNDRENKESSRGSSWEMVSENQQSHVSSEINIPDTPHAVHSERSAFSECQNGTRLSVQLSDVSCAKATSDCYSAKQYMMLERPTTLQDGRKTNNTTASSSTSSSSTTCNHIRRPMIIQHVIHQQTMLVTPYPASSPLPHRPWFHMGHGSAESGSSDENIAEVEEISDEVVDAFGETVEVDDTLCPRSVSAPNFCNATWKTLSANPSSQDQFESTLMPRTAPKSDTHMFLAVDSEQSTDESSTDEGNESENDDVDASSSSPMQTVASSHPPIPMQVPCGSLQDDYDDDSIEDFIIPLRAAQQSRGQLSIAFGGSTSKSFADNCSNMSSSEKNSAINPRTAPQCNVTQLPDSSSTLGSSGSSSNHTINGRTNKPNITRSYFKPIFSALSVANSEESADNETNKGNSAPFPRGASISKTQNSEESGSTFSVDSDVGRINYRSSAQSIPESQLSDHSGQNQVMEIFTKRICDQQQFLVTALEGDFSNVAAPNPSAAPRKTTESPCSSQASSLGIPNDSMNTSTIIAMQASEQANFNTNSLIRQHAARSSIDASTSNWQTIATKRSAAQDSFNTASIMRQQNAQSSNNLINTNPQKIEKAHLALQDSFNTNSIIRQQAAISSTNTSAIIRQNLTTKYSECESDSPGQGSAFGNDEGIGADDLSEPLKARFTPSDSLPFDFDDPVSEASFTSSQQRKILKECYNLTGPSTQVAQPSGSQFKYQDYTPWQNGQLYSPDRSSRGESICCTCAGPSTCRCKCSGPAPRPMTSKNWDKVEKSDTAGYQLSTQIPVPGYQSKTYISDITSSHPTMETDDLTFEPAYGSLSTVISDQMTVETSDEDMDVACLDKGHTLTNNSSNKSKSKEDKSLQKKNCQHVQQSHQNSEVKHSKNAKHHASQQEKSQKISKKVRECEGKSPGEQIVRKKKEGVWLSVSQRQPDCKDKQSTSQDQKESAQFSASSKHSQAPLPTAFPVPRSESSGNSEKNMLPGRMASEEENGNSYVGYIGSNLPISSPIKLPMSINSKIPLSSTSKMPISSTSKMPMSSTSKVPMSSHGCRSMSSSNNGDGDEEECGDEECMDEESSAEESSSKGQQCSQESRGDVGSEEDDGSEDETSSQEEQCSKEDDASKTSQGSQAAQDDQQNCNEEQSQEEDDDESSDSQGSQAEQSCPLDASNQDESSSVGESSQSVESSVSDNSTYNGQGAHKSEADDENQETHNDDSGKDDCKISASGTSSGNSGESSGDTSGETCSQMTTSASTVMDPSCADKSQGRGSLAPSTAPELDPLPSDDPDTDSEELPYCCEQPELQGDSSQPESLTESAMGGSSADGITDCCRPKKPANCMPKDCCKSSNSSPGCTNESYQEAVRVAEDCCSFEHLDCNVLKRPCDITTDCRRRHVCATYQPQCMRTTVVQTNYDQIDDEVTYPPQRETKPGEHGQGIPGDVDVDSELQMRPTQPIDGREGDEMNQVVQRVNCQLLKDKLTRQGVRNILGYADQESDCSSSIGEASGAGAFGDDEEECSDFNSPSVEFQVQRMKSRAMVMSCRAKRKRKTDCPSDTSCCMEDVRNMMYCYDKKLHFQHVPPYPSGGEVDDSENPESTPGRNTPENCETNNLFINAATPSSSESEADSFHGAVRDFCALNQLVPLCSSRRYHANIRKDERPLSDMEPESPCCEQEPPACKTQ